MEHATAPGTVRSLDDARPIYRLAMIGASTDGLIAAQSHVRRANWMIETKPLEAALCAAGRLFRQPLGHMPKP